MASAKTTYRTTHPGTNEEVTFTKGGRPIRWITWGDFGNGFVHFGYSSQETYEKALKAPRSTNPYAKQYEVTPATAVEDEKPAVQAPAKRRPRVVNVEGIGWTCVEPGRKWAAEYEGVKFELERRTRNVRDECPDTGWYLYGGSHFGKYMAARFKEAAVEAFPFVCPKEGHPAPAEELPETAPAAAPARRTITVTTTFVGRSIPTRLRAAGAPGGTAMSSTGTLVWRLPDGEELTPGEAEKRFLLDVAITPNTVLVSSTSNTGKAAPAEDTAPLPWGSRVLRASDGRHGTVTGYGADLRMIITWDRAVVPEPRHYTRAELTAPAFQVFPAVTHCSGCGHVVDDDEIEDSYTTCCNEGACGGCAAVNGVYRCGTEAPAADAA